MVVMKQLYRGASFDWSFEVFPPKSEQGLEPLYTVVQELLRYKPGFISVTYGAGGGTKELSLRIAREIVQKFGVSVTSHLTCVGSTVDELCQWLQAARDSGVSNIMALRGDPPAGEHQFTAVEGGLRYAVDLVQLIRQEFPDFGIGVAGYPETHQEATSAEDDLRHLARKVAAGADAVFTQLFYDNKDFYRFRDHCRSLGIDKPIIPGLLPVLNLVQVKRITSLCKSKLPEDLLHRLENCKDDPNAQISVGVDHCRQQVEDLLASGVPGIHFYVLNRSESIHRILDGLAT
jgi:methylenetetrahydrofolate reductase (NADPH)